MEFQWNPFLSIERHKNKEEEEVKEGRILGWYLLDQYIKRYNTPK